LLSPTNNSNNNNNNSSIPPLSFPLPTSPSPKLPKLSNTKITLAIDLDETLMHSREKSIYKEASPAWAPPPDFCEVVPDNRSAELYQTWVRPHVGVFLRTVSQWFNVVLFTASQRAYAEIMLARIDSNRYVKRIYSRADCTATKGGAAALFHQPAATSLNNEKRNQQSNNKKLPSYVKDLRRLVGGGAQQQHPQKIIPTTTVVGGGGGADVNSSNNNNLNNTNSNNQLLSRVLLLDNYPDVFVQPTNGLSISSFLPIESCEKCDCRNRIGGGSSSSSSINNEVIMGSNNLVNNNTKNQQQQQQQHHRCAAVTDTALLDLLPVLEAIAHLNDVRGVLQYRKNFST